MSKILVANFYPVHPIQHGGQRRIFFLSRELSRHHDVTMVTMNRGGPMRYMQMGPRLTEIQLPAPRPYVDFERSMHEKVPMTADVAYAMRWADCTLYQGVLQQKLRESSIVVSEHPYSVPALLEAMPRSKKIPLIYNSQNVELRQKAPVLAGRDDLMDVVRSVEGAAVRESARIIACSEIDKSIFTSEYSVPAEKIVVVENGVDARAVPQISPDQVRDFRRYLGLDGKFTAIFGGSFHFPNLAAADAILDFARALPDVVFLFLGSICRYQKLSQSIPANVLPLGMLPEREKWLCFRISDLALNPMTQGSGSNIKMFEYAAAELPTLSTNFGARATGLEAGRHYIEAEIQDFPAKLAELAQGRSAELGEIGKAAKTFVFERADWSVIGENYRKLVDSLLDVAAPAAA